uniref:Uncharacterized protein n=1 Tax=Romanomermis culicivorax TaxID=13658 RepID=A0A915J157_ROMCU
MKVKNTAIIAGDEVADAEMAAAKCRRQNRRAGMLLIETYNIEPNPIQPQHVPSIIMKHCRKLTKKNRLCIKSEETGPYYFSDWSHCYNNFNDAMIVYTQV